MMQLIDLNSFFAKGALDVLSKEWKDLEQTNVPMFEDDLETCAISVCQLMKSNPEFNVLASHLIHLSTVHVGFKRTREVELACLRAASEIELAFKLSGLLSFD